MTISPAARDVAVQEKRNWANGSKPVGHHVQALLNAEKHALVKRVEELEKLHQEVYMWLSERARKGYMVRDVGEEVVIKLVKAYMPTKTEHDNLTPESITP